ncbi:MAG TPA: arginine--tRNA ligase [Armatimonadota bacterium]|nr:arginine--tRNA ligase [Armatimonadota bacterium]HOM80549.1 arginine--tRNA ligase [Armatimonadota bacterium]HPO71406.1 arginine--tRNA ligase [Armatimonadota bacterium]HPT97770.1 arginine--tRNA ligase [Armatimonadota bacterium]
MKSIPERIEAIVRQALIHLLGPDGAEVDPLVRQTQDPKFGDYQSNVAMGLAKRLGKKPRDVAAELVAAMDVGELSEPPSIAGPGFINFRIRPSFLAAELEAIQADPRLGMPQVADPQRIIVDFSSPNLAKEMHVGHLRSTIIGDAIARLLEFEGHDVLRLNHVGDWGTQFGMLIQHVRETQPDVLEHPERFHIDDLESFYREAKARFDADSEFADAARRAVVDLQSGDPVAHRLWEVFCTESLRHAHEIYERLGIRLVDRGESFYNPMLPQVVAEFQERGLAVEAEGAVCVFLPGFTNREGGPLPLIIRKSDGGYNYETTDLAALRHRVDVEKAQRVIYITDIRQRQHFEMCFAAARAIGWVPDDVQLDHVGFGMVLGPDRRPFKTREGGTVKLKDLLDEAVSRAAAVIDAEDERRSEMSPEEKAEIARVVGLGAVKYADLSHNLTSDYVFDWDTMLAMDGNTAPYMLYAYARVRSIGRRAGVEFDSLPADLPLVLEHESEIALAKELLRFSHVLQQVSADLRPHLLTDYLYGLSRAFSTFYDRDRGVRVIDAEPESVRLSRLRLCDLTARTLRLGLHLLGIEVLEQM